MTAKTGELTPLDGYEPETVGGVRIFRGVRARGDDIIKWDEQHPAALEGSKWIECDLDETVWPKVLHDITMVDSSLRNSVWNMEYDENIRIMGTKRVPMYFDNDKEDVVADTSEVLAVVDNMRLNGHIMGFCFLRVAGKDVKFGEPEPGFFDQTEIPFTYGGKAVRMESCTVQLSYLDHFIFYIDSEDVSLHRNGLPDFRLGGYGLRFDFTRNFAPERVKAA